MLTTNQNRTNIVPNTLIMICAVLFFVRCGLIAYRTYLPQVSPSKELAWQAPEKMPENSRDLLGRPYLFCFTDHREPIASLWSDAVAGYLLNNREIVRYMKDNFNLIKVDRVKDKKQDETYNKDREMRKTDAELEKGSSEKDDNDEDGGVAGQLRNRYRVYGLFEMIVALPDGTRVESCNLATDRSLMDFLQRTNAEKRYQVAADTAMLNCDFKTACQAYEKCKADAQSLRPGDTNDLYWYIALKHEHRDQEAKRLLDQAMRDSKYDKDAFPAIQYRYMLGEVSDDLISDKCGAVTADYLMGEKLLFDGKTKEAMEKFHHAISKNKMTWFRNYKLARAELVAHGEKLPETKNDDSSSTDQYDSVEFE